MNINKSIIKSVLFVVGSMGTLGVFITKTYAEDNKIGCLLAGNKKWTWCEHTKGDAFLQGIQGFVHTFTFPNGKKYIWFYPENNVKCEWENTYVKDASQNNWFKTNVECGQDTGIIKFQLPSGNTLFEIYSEY
ncbi:MAG: hypothetical protein EAZ76_01480 [Nostocales cyanobacterium]|nr:MAG: hypothetical protein EAZ87_05430 [Nostocales cyanobacterium]TAF20444.1 MAG: hypothetical protein EAZ76_01480 [Nostocales cyanobacterium]